MDLEAVCRRVEGLYRDAERRYGRRFRRPAVALGLRGRRAGTAHLDRCALRFNTVLLVENPEAYRREVIPHEVAHLIAFELHGAGIRPHGSEWRAVMEALGAPARTCHTLDVSRAGVRRVARPYRYRCDCQEHAFTARRHRNALTGSRYRCRCCKGELRWVD